MLWKGSDTGTTLQLSDVLSGETDRAGPLLGATVSKKRNRNRRARRHPIPSPVLHEMIAETLRHGKGTVYMLSCRG